MLNSFDSRGIVVRNVDYAVQIAGGVGIHAETIDGWSQCLLFRTKQWTAWILHQTHIFKCILYIERIKLEAKYFRQLYVAHLWDLNPFSTFL